MTFLIKLDGVEVARVAGQRIQFGRKMASGSLMEKDTIDDREILKQLDENGQAVWVLRMSHRGNLTVEEVP